MSDKTIKYCDVCGETIINGEIDSGFAMIEYYNRYQRWPVEDRYYDICRQCCNKIQKMKQFGIITFDEEPLFIMAGFVKDGDLWRYKEESDAVS